MIEFLFIIKYIILSLFLLTNLLKERENYGEIEF